MSFELTSTAFDHGESIPRRHGYKDANVNPPLDIHEVPEDAVSLAVVVDDPDAVGPAGKVWDHWVVWNVPADTSHIPADWDSGRVIEGRNDYGEQGYGGPNPPDRQHTYRFRAYALDDTLDLDAGATKDELESAMEGHVIADATLEGTYAP
jgi:hypothetical protein